MSVIEANGLSKLYYLGGSVSTGSIRDAITGLLRRPSSANKKKLWAIRDLSFTVGEGETLGIIGRNGAGKSTLLKMLSRITKPTAGSARIRGRVASLLEVGTGFHGELSGRENIFLNGAILGMHRSEITSKFDEIVAFSEVEKFLDTPVKYYSSGMYMRLAFAVAAHLEPEVLIVDEVLAVGDVEFQKKCIGKMDEVSRSGRTVLFVSHNLGSLAQICRNGMLLHHGELQFYGGINEAIREYSNLVETSKQFVLSPESPQLDMQITEARITNAADVSVTEIAGDQNFTLRFQVHTRNIARGAMFCVAMLNKYKDRLFTEHKRFDDLLGDRTGTSEIAYTVPGGLIAPNNYSFLLQIFLPSGEIIQDLFDICPLTIIDAGTEMAPYRDYGYIQMGGEWSVE